MSSASPRPDREALARVYRGLSEREIRARLEGVLDDVERATAKAELWIRGLGDDAAPVAVAGTSRTSQFDVESRSELEPDEVVRPASRWWRPIAMWAALLLVFVAILAALDKLYGEPFMGGRGLRAIVHPPIAALLTGCVRLLAGQFGRQTWGRRLWKLLGVLLLLACTLPLAMCSLFADVHTT